MSEAQPGRTDVRLRQANSLLFSVIRSEAFQKGSLDEALKAVSEAAADCAMVGRVSIWLYNDDHTRLQCQDLYARALNCHQQAEDLLAEKYPRYFQALAENRSIAVPDAQTHPYTNEFTISYLIPNNISSMLDSAIRVDGQVAGVICLEQTDEPRLWTAEDEIIVGNFADLVALALEADERRKVEKAQRVSEEKYARVFHLSPAPFGISRLQDGLYVEINDKWLQMGGYTRDEVIGKTSLDLKLWPDEEIRNNFIEQLRKNGSVRNQERQFITKSGELCFVNVSGALIELDGIECVIWTGEDVTERRQSEQQLRDSENRWRALFEQMPVACQLLSPDGSVRRVNTEWLRMFGVTEAQALQYNILTDEQLKASGALNWMQIAFDGAPVTIPVTRYDVAKTAGRGESEWRWFSVRMFPLTDAQGHVAEICAIYDDVTDTHVADEALRASQRRFATVFYSSPNAHSVQRLSDLSYIEVNDRWLEMTGCRREEVIGQAVEQVEQWVDPKVRHRIHQQLLAGENLEGVEVRIPRKNGEDFVGLVTTRLIEVDDELCILGVTQDITARKQAEDELRASEQRFASAFHSNPSPMSITRVQGGIHLDVNQRWLDFFGYEREEAIGRGDMDLKIWLPEVRARIAEILTREGALRALEVPYLSKTGEMRAGEISAEMIELEGHTCILWSGRDITERKQAEEKILRLNEELERKVAERTEALSAANRELEAFSYSVSHDLRAPLRHITSFSNLLYDEAAGSLSGQSLRHLQIIRDSSKRMGQLIEDLLAFSRLGRSEMRFTSVALSELVRQAQHELHLLTDEREIVWNIDSLPEVSGDSSLLRQVFVNLLSNALKYTRTQATARITVGCQTDHPHEIICFVRDNGVGFEMEYADKLFGVFQRLHSTKDFEGTGIGLANVKRIITRHGGRVWAEGKVNEGATFYFSLPRLKKETHD